MKPEIAQSENNRFGEMKRNRDKVQKRPPFFYKKAFKRSRENENENANKTLDRF